MYGIAGHKYTPGMPYLSALDVKPQYLKTIEAKRKAAKQNHQQERRDRNG